MSKQQAVQPSDWRVYRRLLSYLTPLWRPFLVCMLGFMTFSGAQVLAADWMQFVIDSLAGASKIDGGIVSRITLDLVPGARTDAEVQRTLITAAVVIIAAVRGVGYFVGNYMLSTVSLTIVHRLRADVFNKMLLIPADYFDHSATGNLIAKITYHVHQVTGAATHAVKIVVREGFFVLGLLSYILWMNAQLSLIFAVVLPIIGFVVNYVGKAFRRISKRIQNSVGDYTQVANEVIGGYKEVRLFGGAQYEQQRFWDASERNRKQNQKLALYDSAGSPVVAFFVSLALAILVWMALGMSDGTTAGQFVSYITAAGLLAKPIRQLTEVYGMIQKALAACEDLFEFIDLPTEVDQGNYRAEKVQGKLEFRQVSFAYSNDSADVIKDISFTVEPGQNVALVGLSGSGKSTLVNLLTRFYNHDRGQILLDGVDVNDYTLENLRSHFAIVTQQVTLFNDTVYNNIAYGGMSNADPEDVHRVVEAAHASEFIANLPQGINTIVGEDGVMLSGGQRQRLAIARALLTDAPVLILDEATSALDNKAELHIQAALEAVMAERTTIVIAHRLSTIENADKILVMEEGRIIEQGSHSELMALNKRYAQLYEKRFED